MLDSPRVVPCSSALTGVPWRGFLTAASVLFAVIFTATPAVAWADTPEDVVRAWVSAVNRGDAEAAIALYADDAVIEALGQEFRGKPVIARRQRTIIAAVLRPSVQIDRLTAEGERVTVSLSGENALTRFDRRGPVSATTTFYVHNGKIQREVGPILEPADAQWYASAMPRFRATGALPPLLPAAGEAMTASSWVLAFAALVGLTLLLAGVVTLRHRLRAGAGESGSH